MEKKGLKELFKKFKKEDVSENEFYVLIEIPKGNKTKYELDKETGLLRIDRILFTSTHYPHNYGFIPLTDCEDGDPLDALVLCSEPIFPLTIVKCRPIGVLKMLDEGKNDPKIIAVPIHDPYYNAYNNASELPIHVSEEIQHFFNVYKNLEHKQVITDKVEDADEAKKEVRHCIELYHNKM